MISHRQEGLDGWFLRFLLLLADYLSIIFIYFTGFYYEISTEPNVPYYYVYIFLIITSPIILALQKKDPDTVNGIRLAVLFIFYLMICIPLILLLQEQTIPISKDEVSPRTILQTLGYLSLIPAFMARFSFPFFKFLNLLEQNVTINKLSLIIALIGLLLFEVTPNLFLPGSIYLFSNVLTPRSLRLCNTLLFKVKKLTFAGVSY